MTETTLIVRAGLTLDRLVRGAKYGHPFSVCQQCAAIFMGRFASPCPECGGEFIVADEVDVDAALEQHYPWRPCEHCEYAFLWEDDIAKEIQPDPALIEPGQMGCPECLRLTN